MFRSLRARLILSFVLIVGITLTAAGITLFARFDGYRQDLTTANLKQIAAPIYYNFAVPSTFTSTPRGGQRLRSELMEYIRVQREETGVYVLMLDGSGRVIEDFAADPGPFDDATFFVPLPPERGPNFSELPDGQYTTASGESFLYVTVAMPQSVRRQEASISAIVVALPESAGPPIYKDLRQRLIFAGVIGIAAAAVAGILLWLSLYRPMTRVTAGIRAVAEGDFRQRVPVSGPTELRALATDVNNMASSVEASQRTLRDFLATISHELRTPLTSIRGFSQALTDGTLDSAAETERAARVIDAESRRLLHLVGELMDLSRIESGQTAMNVAPVRVSELFSHVGDVFRLRAGASGVELRLHATGDEIVLADFDRVEQVLGNLLDNAFSHAPRGSMISVTATEKTADIEIRVHDAGAGIAEVDLPHVFDRFYRAQNETAGSGSGLGLAISREIIRAHGGNIQASSAPVSGTSFVFTLPRAVLPAAKVQRAQATLPDRAQDLGDVPVQ